MTPPAGRDAAAVPDRVHGDLKRGDVPPAQSIVPVRLAGRGVRQHRHQRRRRAGRGRVRRWRAELLRAGARRRRLRPRAAVTPAGSASPGRRRRAGQHGRSGQAMPVSGSGHAGLPRRANNGTGSGTGTIVYTDGTTQSFSLAFADWWSGSAMRAPRSPPPRRTSTTVRTAEADPDRPRVLRERLADPRRRCST